MDPNYQKHVENLNSSNPQDLIESAIWFVENSDSNHYLRSCEILYKGASCDPDCVKYIYQKLQNDPIFLTQLFSQVLQEKHDPEVKSTIINILGEIITLFKSVKSDSTELASQMYSTLMETNIPELVQKAKELL